VLLALAAPFAAGAQSTAGVVRGRVTLAVQGVRVADMGPLVVYLEPVDGRVVPPGPPPPETMHQRDARFAPSFLAIAAGQSVVMENDDAIYHNVFSFSRPNAFDLGLYPAGESRTVTFRYPGVVHTYCSIHESMNGTIFVSPSPFFTLVGSSGDFEWRSVPAGSWRLRSWCERLPTATRELRVLAGRSVEANLSIGETAP
jgi:hypothetical protein